MLSVVIGGSASGKSEYAERLAVASKYDTRYYVATMAVFDEESKKRIERHRQMRAQKDFTTIECPCDLSQIEICDNSTYLIECMSNLAANIMFQSEITADGAFEKIIKDLWRIVACKCDVIIVTNDVFSDGVKYDSMTEEYMKLLAKINAEICQEADNVIEVVCGIPIFHKGVRYEIF